MRNEYMRDMPNHLVLPPINSDGALGLALLAAV